MVKRIAGIHVFMLAALLFLIPVATVSVASANNSADDNGFIGDDEEYAVMAALLFPHDPEVPDEYAGDKARTEAYLAHQRYNTRLDGLGLGWRSFRISDLTSREQAGGERISEAEKAMIEDFNEKNSRRWRLENERLKRQLPKGKSVMLVTEQDSKILKGNEPGWEFKKRHDIHLDGLTNLTRVGFSPDKTRAVVGINHQADYEMGVGYRVFLKKSKKSGKWFIEGAVRTRIY